jgi:hypothetical protein
MTAEIVNLAQSRKISSIMSEMDPLVDATRAAVMRRDYVAAQQLVLLCCALFLKLPVPPNREDSGIEEWHLLRDSLASLHQTIEQRLEIDR